VLTLLLRVHIIKFTFNPIYIGFHLQQNDRRKDDDLGLDPENIVWKIMWLLCLKWKFSNMAKAMRVKCYIFFVEFPPFFIINGEWNKIYV
jgi:hypothetical protein